MHPRVFLVVEEGVSLVDDHPVGVGEVGEDVDDAARRELCAGVVVDRDLGAGRDELDRLVEDGVVPGRARRPGRRRRRRAARRAAARGRSCRPAPRAARAGRASRAARARPSSRPRPCGSRRPASATGASGRARRPRTGRGSRAPCSGTRCGAGRWSPTGAFSSSSGAAMSSVSGLSSEAKPKGQSSSSQ